MKPLARLALGAVVLAACMPWIVLCWAVSAGRCPSCPTDRACGRCGG